MPDKVSLNFESADEILDWDYKNESNRPVLSYGSANYFVDTGFL